MSGAADPLMSHGHSGRILHILDHSPPIGDGYAFRSAEIVRFQRRAGWDTVHLTSPKQGVSGVEKETVQGLDFYRTAPVAGPLGSVPVVNQWLVVTRLRRRLSEIVRREAPQVLHVHSPCLNALAALPIARRHGLPLLYEVRALWEDGAVDSGNCREGDARYRVSRALETHVCMKADRVVTICEGLRQELASRGIPGGRIRVAPNSVDLERFSRGGPRDEALSERIGLVRGKTLGFIGTFFPFEGLPVLIQAAARILRSEPRARFLLVGDGPDSGRARALARELGVQGAVIFAGRVPHAEVERYYRLIDVMVYPRISNRVTQLVTPLKPLEAMAQGKLVVASDVGGHREMIFPSYNGKLFTAGDALSLAEACIGLLRRPEEWPALRANALEYVSGSRTWAKNVAVYSEIYDELISRR